MRKQGFRFELKGVTDEGTFEGILSTYGNVDLGGDLVRAGAFTKSINEKGGEIPMLWSHKSDQPIGILQLEDSSDALRVKGRLVLEVERAREVLALMKSGVVKGLSIGYDVVKSNVEKGVRNLVECRLWEGSAVVFPMNPLAQVDPTSVKSDESKQDFTTALVDIQTWALRYQLVSALDSSLDSILWDSKASVEDRRQQVADSIDQFKEKYLDFLPRWSAMMDGYKSLPDLLEQKAGRRISGATRKEIEEAISKLQALLVDAAAEGTEETEAAKQYDQEPVADHSWLLELKNQISGELTI
jgi:HK97 family phage prohead protease